MINRIVIADMATYPHAPSMMDGLSKINFVYGANGAGKTTIPNFLSSLESNSNTSSIELENSLDKQYV